MADRTRHARHESDAWVRQARSDGYRSRAVYKLREIDQRDGLLKPGGAVLDIGAAPGSWSQYAAASVGRGGAVVAVDLDVIKSLPGVLSIRGDICDPKVRQQCCASFANGCNLAICDVAPHITGIASADQARMQELLESALELAAAVLNQGADALFKVFSGDGESAFRALLRQRFRSVRVRKPAASRQSSAEFYLLCKDYKG